jgi:hypothetical protein
MNLVYDKIIRATMKSNTVDSSMKKIARKQARYGASKKPSALGSFIIGRRIAPLRELAAFASPGPKRPKGLNPLAAEVAGVLEAAEGTAYPTVPSLAAERFNGLAAQATLRLHAGDAVAGIRPGVFIKPVPDVAVGLHSAEGQGAAGVWAFQLAYGFFMNPERDRLRRCAVCRDWFVDVTKNRSARRCSRACTIAWSNKQRPLRGGA